VERYTVKIRGTATDKLADVIQSLQLVRKSGKLTAERDGLGNSSEVGTITFRDGQVVDASIGYLRGEDAFKKLAAWTTCRFLFEPASSTSFSSFVSPPSSLTAPAGQRYGQTHSYEQSPTVIVPYRSQHIQGVIPDFQRLGLSRAHRQLFLLIDGRRSVQELARLVGRQPQDVLLILADLERAGLISQ
jgi:hypothetical protein